MGCYSLVVRRRLNHRRKCWTHLNGRVFWWPSTHEALKQIAEIEKRTLSGQFTFIFEKYCEEAGYEIIKKDKSSKPSKKIIELD